MNYLATINTVSFLFVQSYCAKDTDFNVVNLHAKSLQGVGESLITIIGPSRGGAADDSSSINVVFKDVARNKIRSVRLKTTFPNHLEAAFATYKGRQLLAISGDGGQFRFATVYTVAKSLAVSGPLCDPVIMGDFTQLNNGRVIEHCPARYANLNPPVRRRKGSDVEPILTRAWTFDAQRMKFEPGPYIVPPGVRREPNRTKHSEWQHARRIEVSF